MNTKIVASLLFLLNASLFGTYYAVSKEALVRVDPLIFSSVQMLILVPIALFLIGTSWRRLTKKVIKQGIQQGSCLGLSFLMMSITLKYTMAMATAFFPSLNGFLALLVAWVFLRQPIAKVSWLAGLLSVTGVFFLSINASTGGARIMFVAFLGGLFLTCYIFLTDQQEHKEIASWALLGIQLLTVAALTTVAALAFGNWQNIHFSLPGDILVLLYTALECTFIPMMITILAQKHLSPVTVSFIYILEPIIGTLVAHFFLNEAILLNIYIGGILVIVGTLLHLWGTAWNTRARQAQLQRRGFQ